METEKVKKVEKYLLEAAGPGSAIIYKVVDGVVETIHTIRNFACDCPGYKYRKECHHIELVTKPWLSDPTAAEEAKKVAEAVLAVWTPVFKSVRLEPDPSEVVSMLRFSAWDDTVHQPRRFLSKPFDPGPLVELVLYPTEK